MFKIKIEERQKGIVNLKIQLIENILKDTLRDLEYISLKNRLRKHIYKSEQLFRSELEELAQEYSSFMNAEKKFKTISLIDNIGWELIRVDYNEGNILIASSSKLKNIYASEDFKESLKLKPGQTYISSFTPDFKTKKLESLPWKPILKFIKPIFSNGNNRKGTIIVEYFASPIIDRIKDANFSPISQPLLVNNDGYFIIGPTGEFEWDFIDEAKNTYFIKHIDPDLWKLIKDVDRDQIYRPDGLYTFQTINPLPLGGFKQKTADSSDDVKPYFWKVISFVPKTAFKQWESPFVYSLFAVYVMLFLIICFISWKQSGSILDKELAFRELIKSEEKYKILLEKANIGIFICENKKITFSNLHFLKMLQTPATKITNFKFNDLFFPSEIENEAKKYRLFASNQEAPNLLEARLKSNGLKRFLNVDLSISVIQKKSPEILVISVSDITKRKFNEMELEKQNLLLKKITSEEKMTLYEQLQHADRLATLGQFSATLIHDINEPITNILGLAELAKKNTSLPEQTQNDISDIITSSLHARTIIKNVLNFSRKSTGESSINLNEIIKENLYLFDNKCSRINIKIILKLDSNIPFFIADRSKISQVFVNLLSNAIAAMPEGGDLTITTSFTDKKIYFSITDTGIGMDQTTITKIFDPFFTTKNPNEGTGLGLSVVKEILESYNGSITVNSNPGKGSTFELSFEIPNHYL